MRRAITGSPKAGKTTIAGARALHTDDLKDLHSWSAASEVASSWFDMPGSDLCVEGVTVPRALRKWLATHPEGRPIDELLVLGTPHQPLTPGQQAMAKGINTVLKEIEPELIKRGVKVIRQ